MRQWMTALIMIAAMFGGASADGCLSADDPFQTGCGSSASMYDGDEYDEDDETSESEEDNETDPRIRDD